MPDHIQVEMRPSSTARFKATRHQRSLGALTAPAFRIGSLREPRQVQRCFGRSGAGAGVGCQREAPHRTKEADDPDTGSVEIVRYTSIDDCGRAVNPIPSPTHIDHARGVLELAFLFYGIGGDASLFTLSKRKGLPHLSGSRPRDRGIDGVSDPSARP